MRELEIRNNIQNIYNNFRNNLKYINNKNKCEWIK